MERASCLVFPAAILGSIFVFIVAYSLSASIRYPVYDAVTEPVAADTEFDINQKTDSNGADQSAQTALMDCEVSKQFPKAVTKWCAVITKYAKKNHLPPDLIAAMVWQESGGNPKAYSGSGAVGLMQIMPRDGIAASFVCSGGACFANRPTMEQLKDPEFNIKYGARMLAGLVKKHGSYREALKAYGPMDSGYYYADKVLSIYKRYGIE